MEEEEDGAEGVETLVKVVISVVDVMAKMAEDGRNYLHPGLCEGVRG